MAIVCAVLSAVGLAGSSVARADVPTPTHNLALGKLADSCGAAPTGAECENSVIYRLNAARSIMGLGPYALPPDFAALPPERQLLILANLDRGAYGIAPVAGLNSTLDGDAAVGARDHNHPLPSLSNYGYATNWAGEFPNALTAYYFWYYDDGYPGNNVSCKAPTDHGCWGHRRNILWSGNPEDPGAMLLMGAAEVTNAGAATGYGLLIVEPAPGTSAGPDAFSWEDAILAGAGSFPYDPGQPLTINAGGGTVTVAGSRCTGTCLLFPPTGSVLTFKARGRRGVIPSGWKGSCADAAQDCTLVLRAPAIVGARFARARLAGTLYVHGRRVDISGRIRPSLAHRVVTATVRRGHRSWQLTTRTSARGTFHARRTLPRGAGRITATVRIAGASKTLHPASR